MLVTRFRAGDLCRLIPQKECCLLSMHPGKQVLAYRDPPLVEATIGMQTWKVGLYHAGIHCEVYDVVESARPVAHEAATTTLDVQSVQLGNPRYGRQFYRSLAFCSDSSM